MAKSRREIEKNLRLVDAVAEILDARIPQSSRNPDLDRMVGDRPRVVLLNKADLADPAHTRGWLERFSERGVSAAAVDCRGGKGLERFQPLMETAAAGRIERWKQKGMAGRRIRVMVLGVPNVGKSSLINRLAGGSRAAAEDRPGVTRSLGWFPVGKKFEILDTPGVLWPKFEDPAVGEKLAFTGAVRDEVVDAEALACRLLEVLRDGYARELGRRYRLEGDLSGLRGCELLEKIGAKRGMLLRGGEIDTVRAAAAVLDEFRAGKIGRITLERAGA